MTTYRQGDVLIIAAKLPQGAADTTPANGADIILALGEATGHAHRISGGGITVLEKGGRRYLDVREPRTLRHEEHSEIPLAPGGYEVITQMQYTPQGLINVAD